MKLIQPLNIRVFDLHEVMREMTPVLSSSNRDHIILALTNNSGAELAYVEPRINSMHHSSLMWEFFTWMSKNMRVPMDEDFIFRIY